MATVLDSSIGLKAESTYGTGVTVDQFIEFVSESLNWRNEYVQSAGQRVGARVDRSAGRVLSKVSAGGTIVTEAWTKGLGRIIAAALGASTSTETADTGVYLQVHTPLKNAPHPSYTIQKGIAPTGGGSVQPYTFHGAQCEQLEIDFSNSEIVKLSTEWNAVEVDTGTAYASPSYPASNDLLGFVHGGIYLGQTITKATTTTPATTAGSQAANVVGGKITVKNNLDTDGYNLGGAGKRTRRQEVGKLEISGTLEIELTDAVLRDALLNQTRLSLLLEFVHPSQIGASSHPMLQVHIPAIVLEGSLPEASQAGPKRVSMSFKGLDLLTAGTEPIYINYLTTDTAI